jgi:hypothetical protein
VPVCQALERGRFIWPSSTEGAVTISSAQLGLPAGRHRLALAHPHRNSQCRNQPAARAAGFVAACDAGWRLADRSAALDAGRLGGRGRGDAGAAVDGDPHPRLRGRAHPCDGTAVPVLAKGKTCTGRERTYVDDRPFAGPDPPAAVFSYSRDRDGDHPEQHWAAGLIQADAYGGFNTLRGNTQQRSPFGPMRDGSCSSIWPGSAMLRSSARRLHASTRCSRSTGRRRRRASVCAPNAVGHSWSCLRPGCASSASGCPRIATPATPSTTASGAGLR